jgi:hypothetical protein
MAILVSDVITRAQYVLNDTNTRWVTAEMLVWVNDALREITVRHPEAATVIANLTLAAGTKQTLPAGAVSLGRLIRNMGAGGATPAEAPRLCSQLLMDLHLPTWHAATATLVVKNYMKDERFPRTYYVYPPMSGATQVEAEYLVIPTPITATSDALPIPDIYTNAVVDYVLYRAFAKELELPGMPSKSQAHYAAFNDAVGAVETGEETQK